MAQVLNRARPLAAAAVGAFAGISLTSLWSQDTAIAESPPAALDPKSWKPFRLIEKEALTHNTARYRFALENPDQVVGLPVASCLLTRAPLGTKDDGSPSFAIRPYTPVSAPDQRGFFELVIKVYAEGKMTQHLHNMKVGETLDCKGPIIKLKYEPNLKKAIGMVAGGTGITPMLQVADEVLRNPDDKTQVSLVFANVSPDDIICKDKIDNMAKKHKNFKVYYLVDKLPAAYPAASWQGGVGYITKDVLKEHLPPPSPDHLVAVCGPPGLMKVVSGDKAPDKSQGELSGYLKELGYTSDMVFKF